MAELKKLHRRFGAEGRSEESISCRSSESNDFDLFLSGGNCGEFEWFDIAVKEYFAP